MRRYPADAVRIRASGYVIVQFDVDEEGRVRDPFVVESDSDRGRGKMFHQAALEAARRFRYIPRFENATAVGVPEVRNRITFELE